MAHFTMGTGGHYITVLPADWSISISHDPLPSSCHSKKMLWNPSIIHMLQGITELALSLTCKYCNTSIKCNEVYSFFSYTPDAAISRRPIWNKREAEITETAIDYMYNVAYVGGQTLHDTATLVASCTIHVSQVCTNTNTAL